MKRIGRQVQDLFDQVFAAHAGGDWGAVRQALAHGAAEAELHFSNDQLDAYAEPIAEGRRVRVETSTGLA